VALRNVDKRKHAFIRNQIRGARGGEVEKPRPVFIGWQAVLPRVDLRVGALAERKIVKTV